MPFPLVQVLYIIGSLLLAGVFLWMVSKWPDCDEAVKVIIRIVVIFFVSVFVIYMIFGIIAGLPPLPMRK